jgi:hypothetical protein
MKEFNEGSTDIRHHAEHSMVATIEGMWLQLFDN